MGSYEVIVSLAVAKQMMKISEPYQKRIRTAIGDLSGDPRPDGCKKLSGRSDNAYRIRVGKYRVMYQIKDDELIVVIIKTGKRGDFYD